MEFILQELLQNLIIKIISNFIYMNLCQYKDIFGKPKEGAHSYRIFDIAIVDVAFTLIGAYVISYYFDLPLLPTTISLFILGIIMHYMFCVDTTINKLLLK